MSPEQIMRLIEKDPEKKHALKMLSDFEPPLAKCFECKHLAEVETEVDIHLPSIFWGWECEHPIAKREYLKIFYFDKCRCFEEKPKESVLRI